MSKIQAPGKTNTSQFRSSSAASLLFAVVLSLALASPFFIIYAYSPAPGIYLLWDWANACGYLAFAAFLLLFFYTGRPRNYPTFSGRFFTNLHRYFGYIALLLTALHVGVLLAVDPLLFHHLKLTAPYSMLAALAATILIIIMVISAIPAIRKRLWPNYLRFKATHGSLTLLALALTLCHIIGNQYYLNTPIKQGLFLLIGLLIVGAYFIQKNRIRVIGENNIERHRNTAHHALTISTICTLSLLLGSLAISWIINQE